MALKRPRQRNYDSEPDFLLACLRYLDAKYPGREGTRKRVAAWQRWNEEHDADVLRSRLRELVELDAMSPADEAEFDRLAAAWKARVRGVRTTPDITERNER